ncbi:ExbD/TolR family protein [Pontimicrobium sp. IMCC45349]|uniref:ExbD/TolR family protein n=1 Tax=Pontimicrobium sp. IMCC45349 TaxID=3391574 RepID=UPI0039A032E2
MRQSKRSRPEVNAGSMADIAFLLLVFFLVTAVIPDDQGFNRKLPKKCPDGQNCNTDIHDRNILQIILNNKNQVMIEDKVVSLSEVKDITKRFIDNNGDNSCNYCFGAKLSNSSDNPKKAVVSLQTHPESTYEAFIGLQDEITKAYYELRANYAKTRFNKSTEQLTKDEIKELKEVFPFILSEASTR